MTAAKKALGAPPGSFAEDVRAGLGSSPKTLPPRYFYDALGSHLFDAICHLPWYPITRAESRLLELHAAAMLAPLADLAAVVELGCGSGDKIAVLAAALAARGGAGGDTHVHLVNVSDAALELTRRALGAFRLAVTTHRATYEEGLRRAVADRPGKGSVLVLFLGSNIGNFDPPGARAMLEEIRRALRPGDGLLLGADLVKPRAELLAAYDDPLGVTAAFNKNMLLRANRELGASFDLADFDHRAVWNEGASRVEMHLVSRRRHEVRVPASDLTVSFAEGETIWTESSYKHTAEGLAEMGRAADLHRRGQWIEPALGFASTLFVAGA